MGDDEDDDEIVVEKSSTGESVRTRIAVLEAKVKLLAYVVRNEVVHRYQFEPVKLISFGFAAIVISSVLVAVLSYVIRKV